MALFLLCRSHHYYSSAAPEEGDRAEAGAGPGLGGRKRCRTAAPGPGKCTQVIFVRRDQKAFTFRCFPDMNIQHPYWNLIWVSFSQGSFHQCLLPEATADWQPNFSEEQAGGGRRGGVKKKRSGGISGGVGDVRAAQEQMSRGAVRGRGI